MSDLHSLRSPATDLASSQLTSVSCRSLLSVSCHVFLGLRVQDAKFLATFLQVLCCTMCNRAAVVEHDAAMRQLIVACRRLTTIKSKKVKLGYITVRCKA